MKKDSAFLTTTFTVKHVSFNSDGRSIGCIYLRDTVSRNSIYNLTSTIYQTVETSDELKDIKSQMIEVLVTEMKLIKDLLRRNTVLKKFLLKYSGD